MPRQQTALHSANIEQIRSKKTKKCMSPNCQAHEETFGEMRLAAFDPEFALALPICAPVRGETTLLPAEVGR